MALDDTKTLAERILRLEQKLQRLEKREGRPSVELFDNSAIRNRKIIDDLLVHNHTHANLSGLDADDHTQYLNTTRHDVTDRHTLGTVVPHDSHSSLSNLSNDDHTQYLNETRHDTTDRHALGTVVPHDDHGLLSGLGDDDHTQYLNTTRHDTTARHTLGTVVPHDDHGQLTGLADDDHTQYTKHPASSTDNAIARWDGTGGRTLQNSGVTIDDSNNLLVNGNYQTYKNSTTYTGYLFVPLTTPLTSTSWDGDTKTTSNRAIVDLSTVFGVPAGIKAVLMSIQTQADAVNEYIRFGPNSTYNYALICRTPVASQIAHAMGIVPCDSNGDVYCYPSGTIENVYVYIWGYWL